MSSKTKLWAIEEIIQKQRHVLKLGQAYPCLCAFPAAWMLFPRCLQGWLPQFMQVIVQMSPRRVLPQPSQLKSPPTLPTPLSPST